MTRTPLLLIIPALALVCVAGVGITVLVAVVHAVIRGLG